MKKIKIIALHLAYGGVEKAICNMANLLCERHEVEIICMYDMPDAPAYELNDNVKIQYLMKKVPNKKEFMDSVKKKNIFKIIREGIKSLQILSEKKRKMKKLACSIHDGIVITTRNEDTVIFNTYADKNLYIIAQLHHDHKFDKNLIHDFQTNYTNINVLALLTPQLCAEVKDMMKEHNKYTECIVVPNFITELPYVFPTHKNKVFLSVGRLHNVKGFDRLIRMFPAICKDFPSWELHIIGDGEEEEALKKIVQESNGNSNISFLGKRTSEEIETMMKEASVFLMTSYSEGFPFVLLEAMSCKLPVIAYDVRVGPRAIIENEKNGFLIQDDDEQAFVEACHSLMMDSNLRLHMGNHAYESVQKYTRSEVSKIWFELLEKGNLSNV